VDSETHLHLARLKKICCPYGPFVCWIDAMLDITSHLSITVKSHLSITVNSQIPLKKKK